MGLRGDSVRTIKVIVDTQGDSGLKNIANQMKQLTKNTKESADILGQFKGAFLSLAGYLGIKQITTFSDSMQLLTDRIKIFVGSNERANEVVGQLAEVANYTKSSISDLGNVYNRFSVATQGLGLSSEAVLSTVQLLQQTFRLSGATQEEAAGSTIQLSQAFSLGALRGQELRSVLLGNADLAARLRKAIAELGGTTEEWGRKGLITPAFLLKVLSNNFKDINEKANTLSATFGQTITTATNDLTVAIGKLNQELGISSKFAAGVESLKNNLPLIGSAMVVIATTQIPRLIAGITALFTAIKVFVAANPYTALGAVILGVISYIIFNFDKVSLYFKKFALLVKETFIETFDGLLIIFNGFFLNNALFKGTAISNAFLSLQENLGIAAASAKNDVKLIDDEINKLGETAKKTSVVLNNAIPSNLKDKIKAKTLAEQLKEAEESLGRLNKAFQDSGGKGVEEYNRKFENLTLNILKIKQASGKLSLAKFNEDVAKLNREEISNLFQYGTLSVEDFNEAIRQLDLEKVNQKFKEGKIDALEFHQEILKLSHDFEPGSALFVGVNDYIKTSGTLSQNIARGITTVFNTLEDTLFDFIKKGTFEFAKFTQAILDDLTRIILRAAIVQPLAAGILGSLSSLNTPNNGANGLGVNANGSSVTEGGFAMGGAFNNGVQFYAGGGIVNRTTSFGMSSGRTGIMGESGPEAILPLERGPSGKLGVKGGGSNVTVNVINQSGNEVTQNERKGSNGEKVIDILITSKVKEAFSSGAMDKTMSNLYNVRRKGG